MGKLAHSITLEPVVSRSLVAAANRKGVARTELVGRYVREGLKREGLLRDEGAALLVVIHMTTLLNLVLAAASVAWW